MLVLDLANVYKQVRLPVVWTRATHYNFPGGFCERLCGYFEHQRRVQFDGSAAEPLQTITGILLWSEWSCLLLRIVLHNAESDVMKLYPPMQMKVFVYDIIISFVGQPFLLKRFCIRHERPIAMRTKEA